MNFKEFIVKNFGGNLAAWARSEGVPYRTAWDILNRDVLPQHALRARLKRKGVSF